MCDLKELKIGEEVFWFKPYSSTSYAKVAARVVSIGKIKVGVLPLTASLDEKPRYTVPECIEKIKKTPSPTL